MVVSIAGRLSSGMSVVLPFLAILGMVCLAAVIVQYRRYLLEPRDIAMLVYPWVALAPYLWSSGAISRYGVAALVLDILMIGVVVPPAFRRYGRAARRRVAEMVSE
jgi:hypothetical protein